MEPAVWTALYAEHPLPEALEILYDHGWRAFECSTEHLVQIETAEDADQQIARTRQCLADLHVAMPQGHGLLRADVADRDEARRDADVACLSRQIEVAARLGIRVLVIHPGGRWRAATTGERDWVRARNVEAFRRLGDQAGAHGMRIGLENLMRPGASMPYEMLDLLDAIDHPAIGITLDTSHANVVGLDLPTTVGAFGPYLIATHISDNDGSGDQHLTPGNGDIDWPPVVRALREADYHGLFDFEIPGERHAVLPLRTLKSRHACQVAAWLVTL
ncbi:MAG: sugar phosphate isomerase/epimerase [Anaerolineae bacterium]|nr:sugar phosphate isomerase/epimerase [Anaerolineae bacterium]